VHKPNHYECTVCHKRFQIPSQLARHAVTHNAEREYGCSQCLQRFHKQANLIAHERR